MNHSRHSKNAGESNERGLVTILTIDEERTNSSDFLAFGQQLIESHVQPLDRCGRDVAILIK
ncbi:MAG: hypothetical protein U5L03_16320 [Burkholderiaceae bacterium]|nr:hypothetical protein [Burkholderiaceae bacterium]